jgi:histidine kinase
MSIEGDAGILFLVFQEFDRERRRIEGALHDGVQQDLAAAAVAVQLARQLLETDPPAAAQLLDELESELEAALERVRALAQDVYPSALSIRRGSRPLEIDEAVHFSCRALGGDPRVWEEAGELRFEVAGSFDDAAAGHARARVESVGGQLSVSRDGVAAAIPLSPSER